MLSSPFAFYSLIVLWITQIKYEVAKALSRMDMTIYTKHQQSCYQAMNQWSVAGLTCVFIVLKTQTLSLDCRTSPNFIWFGRCDLNLLVWVDRTRLHSQHAFQQVCLYTLTWLLKSHSCGDRSHAVHCGSPSVPLLHRCSPLSFWPYCQYFSSCLL